MSLYQHLRPYGHIGIDEWPAHLQDAINRALAVHMKVQGDEARGKTAVSGMTYTLGLVGCQDDAFNLRGAMRPRAQVGSSAGLPGNASHALTDCEERVEALRSLLRVEALLCDLTVWLGQVRCNVCQGKGKDSRNAVCSTCSGRGWEREVS